MKSLLQNPDTFKSIMPSPYLFPSHQGYFELSVEEIEIDKIVRFYPPFFSNNGLLKL